MSLDDTTLIAINGLTKNVIAWPANSSATTSRGSVLPVDKITSGANFTQITEPAKAKAAIAIDIEMLDMPKCHISPKIIVGGREPHVPGARGIRPRPKHDVRSLFIIMKR